MMAAVDRRGQCDARQHSRARCRLKPEDAMRRLTVVGLVVALIALAGCGGPASPAPIATAPASAVATLAPSPSAAASPSSAASESPAAAGTPVLVDPFTSAGAALEVEDAAHAADPSTYVTQIPSSSSSVQIVFALKPGTVGRVTMNLTSGGTSVMSPLSIDYGTINSWGHFKIDSSSGFSPGVYVATLTFEPTGAAIQVAFESV
jgi:hypothetical protein